MLWAAAMGVTYRFPDDARAISCARNAASMQDTIWPKVGAIERGRALMAGPREGGEHPRAMRASRVGSAPGAL